MRQLFETEEARVAGVEAKNPALFGGRSFVIRYTDSNKISE